MTTSPIKKARIVAGLTQIQVAKAMGVSQPTYQRWESRAVNVPTKQLDKLAKVLDCTLSLLIGKPEPFDLLGIDKNISDKYTYFGEVAFHFHSGSRPLLLPISDAVYTYLNSALSNADAFIEITSLDNRPVFIRNNAISDIFFSSDAYDDYGPDDYGDQHLGIFPYDAFWKILEHSECIECLEDEFSPQEIKDVLSNISPVCNNSDNTNENDSNQSDIQKIVDDYTLNLPEKYYDRARKVTWQLSKNRIRQVSKFDNKELYEEFSILPLSEEDDYFYFATESFHRSIFIKLANVDFISVPTHKYREGILESRAEDLSETI